MKQIDIGFRKTIKKMHTRKLKGKDKLTSTVNTGLYRVDTALKDGHAELCCVHFTIPEHGSESPSWVIKSTVT